MSSCMFYDVSKVRQLPTIRRDEVEYIKTYDKIEEKYNRKWDVDINIIFDYIENATPFRNSTTDSVYSEDYRAILIYLSKNSSNPYKTYTYFVYRDKRGRTLIEMPYNAIYTVDPGLFDYLDGIIYPNKGK